MQINDIFHNCPEQQEQQQQQQSDPKDLGSKFPRSKSRWSSLQKCKSPLENFHMVSTYHMLPSFLHKSKARTLSPTNPG